MVTFSLGGKDYGIDIMGYVFGDRTLPEDGLEPLITIDADINGDGLPDLVADTGTDRLAFYWGNEKGEKLAGYPRLTEIRAGSEGTLRFPVDRPSPDGARFVLVFAANQNGESRKPARWQPRDEQGNQQ